MSFLFSRSVLFSLATVGLITGVSGCRFGDRIIEVTNTGGGKNIINCTKGTISVENGSGLMKDWSPKGFYTPEGYGQEYSRLHREWSKDRSLSFSEAEYTKGRNMFTNIMRSEIQRHCK